ncbi:TraB/GumN family protein [Sphingomonas sp. PAMC 26605]|uniref:TraB/GumN family protein n=1 Tax=Sphingomonas sp. PAMC 26605 TaxID=1112214 RepID=UPI00026CC5DF|nr:TraB/GumN family protein [Sphingomonas sp. PAMC 26605]
MSRAGAAIGLALALAGCGQAPEIPAHPALWRVADGDTTIWLFGSIHALPPRVAWQTPAVAGAIAAADTLILEVPPADDGAARAQFLALAQQPGLPPLLDRVAPSDRGVLARGMAAAGQSPETLDGLKTWAAALTIGAGAGHIADADAAHGVEAVLTRAFAGKAIGALESREGQLRLFDRLPAESQRTLLIAAARDALSAAQGDAALLTAWKAGDAAGLVADVAPLRRDRAIGAALVTDRNARWAGAIVRRLARPGRVFVAVGAGHLVGPGSVVAMLQTRGLKVERVE